MTARKAPAVVSSARRTVLFCLAAFMFAASQCAASDDLGMGRNDEWRSVCVDRVRLNGPLGRRIALTATNNLMKIDLEKDFFGPFRNKTSKEGFIGLGKLLDGAAYLAKYTGLPEVIERKREIPLAPAEDVVVEDVQRDGWQVETREFCRAVFCVRQGVDHAVDAARGKGFDERGIEVFADADELHLPVEPVFRYVSEEPVEFAPPRFARQSKRDHDALCFAFHAV